MNISDAVSEATDAEGESEIPSAVTSVMETLAPSAARGVGSSNFATVAGAVSLFRAVRSFRKGERKRGLLRAAVGLFWVGVVLARRRRKRGSDGSGASQVTDAGSDLEEAVEPGERETDHATGAGVVNTTDADIEESDTAPEVETSTEIDRDAEDVDQRDVVGSDEVEAADEPDRDDESDTGGTEDDEFGAGGTETETGTRTDGSDAETETADGDGDTGEETESESTE